MNPDTKEVSAVVCTWNAENIIEECLVSLRSNNVGEIVVVDASSTDRTRQIASNYADTILTDPRKGLAYARNIGIAKTKGKYILNCGSDNVLPDEALAKMLKCLIDKKYTGVSAVTYLKDTQASYLAKAMDLYKRARFYPGERPVIGTPTLFLADILKEYLYDSKMGWSDDSDLCDRLAKLGHSFAIADAFVWEIGSESLAQVLYRWNGYGRSDWEIYSKYSPSWSLERRLKSFVHPLRVEFIQPLLRLEDKEKIDVFPFLMLVTLIRYASWVKHTIYGLKKN